MIQDSTTRTSLHGPTPQTASEAGTDDARQEDWGSQSSRSKALLAVGSLATIAASVTGIVPGILIVPLGLLIVLVVCRASGLGWSFLGFARPSSWPRTLAIATAIAVGLTSFSAFVVLPLLPKLGIAGPDLSAFAAVRGNPAQLLVLLAVSWTLAAFGEEVIFRGFLFGAWRRLFGNSALAIGVGLISLSIFFGLAHAYQGTSGIVLTGVAGLVIGALYLKTRNLWAAILAHGITDTIGFVSLYAGWI